MGLKAVGESVSDPLTYYDVNVGGTISVLSAMSKAECNNMVFSSSATVYGIPQYLPYDEEHPTNPVNPYGRTKLMIENIILDWTKVNSKRKGTILRYFNPTGAHESCQIGEEPIGIPNNLMLYTAQIASGRQEFLKIYGDKYDTIDGTGSKDYIRVVDLSNAHLKALENQFNLESFSIMNIGSGKGTTVFELVKSFEDISEINIKFKIVDCRDGDLPAFWADASHAFKLIGWRASLNLDRICLDTWQWQSNNSNGYDK